MTVRKFKLKIHEESELFSDMDPDQNMLSDDVISYLSRCFLRKHRQPLEQYELEIVSDTPVNEEHVTETIRNEFRQQQDDLSYGLKRLVFKEVCLGIIGVVILSIWLVLSAKSESVNVEILSIMGWVCIWEATSIFIMERPELRRMKIILARLTKAEIHFSIAEDNTEDVSA